MRLNDYIDKRIDELDLSERIASLRRGLSDNNNGNNSNSPSNGGSGTRKQDEPDEFDLQDMEDRWYQELQRHGISFEMLTNDSVSSEVVYGIYQEWIRSREERGEV